MLIIVLFYLYRILMTKGKWEIYCLLIWKFIAVSLYRVLLTRHTYIL